MCCCLHRLQQRLDQILSRFSSPGLWMVDADVHGLLCASLWPRTSPSQFDRSPGLTLDVGDVRVPWAAQLLLDVKAGRGGECDWDSAGARWLWDGRLRTVAGARGCRNCKMRSFWADAWGVGGMRAIARRVGMRHLRLCAWRSAHAMLRRLSMMWRQSLLGRWPLIQRLPWLGLLMMYKVGRSHGMRSRVWNLLLWRMMLGVWGKAGLWKLQGLSWPWLHR